MKDIFLIEYQERTALFAPLKGLILEVRENEKKQIAQLIDQQYFSFNELMSFFPEIDSTRLFKKEPERQDAEEGEFRPTSVVLFPTLDCNLRCIYCYSKAGEQKKSMDWQTAKTAIDLVVQNAKLKKREEIVIEFHGGGEPTWNWPIFKRAVTYFQEKARQNVLLPKINLATNGMLSKKQIEWIASRINSVQVSLDGMPEIQNYQRPTAKGTYSFDVVYNTIKLFLMQNLQLTIRCTITEIGIDKISEITRFFAENFPRTAIHFEPVCECGRGLQTGQKFPSADFFIQEFIKAEKIAESYGVEISYSGANQNLTQFRRAFCGVCSPNFIVVPGGIVSACHEVAEETHPLADYFIYGQLEDESFIFDYEKIKRIKNDSLCLKSGCTECFTQHYCAGECLAKNLMSGGELNPRCKVNQELTKHYIFKRLFKKEVNKVCKQ